MSVFELSQAGIDQARTTLMQPAAYAAFDLLPDGRRISGCMDPRPDEAVHERQFTKMMGPGGEVGEAVDYGLALTVVGGQLVTPDDALDRDMALRRTSVHGAHHDCAFVASITDI